VDTDRRTRPPRRAADAPGWRNPDGNERLTAITGAVLLLLFAAEGVTLLSLRQLLTWHYVIGFLLVGPVCLKIASTLYRFARYYTGDRAYVRKGPPQPLLRLLGPFVVLTTLAVLGTGVLLGVEKSAPSYAGFSLLFLHKASFVLWAGCMTIHVLAYIWRLPGLVGADLQPARSRTVAQAVGGRGLRWSLLAVALGAGAVLAAATEHLAAAWQR
jgi:hypothetical protein